MNEREAQELLDLLAQHGLPDLELDQTGGNVYAVIRRVPGGITNFVWQDENIGIHFYAETDWQDGEEPSNFAEVHLS